MADKGFNIHALLVGKGSTLIIPPVLRDKSRFSKKNYKATFNVHTCKLAYMWKRPVPE